MNKIIISILIFPLILSSCSIDWNNEKDKKITELEKKINNDNFNKKQECLKYKESLDFIKMAYSIDYGIQLSDKALLNLKESRKIDEIFYSQIWNSCYFVVSNYTLGNDLQKVNQYELFNLLEQKKIAEKIDCYESKNCSEKWINESKNYDIKLAELKWK